MVEFTYFGKKNRGPCRVYVGVEYFDGVPIPISLKHIVRHSPDGFQWGYGGSGPSDLALSIMTDFSKRKEMELYLYTNEINKK